MNKNIQFQDLGLKDYKATWEYQEELFKGIVDLKIQNRKDETSLPTPNYFLFVEHRPKRKIMIDENLVYLSDPDEIDAYALSIAIELIRNLGRTRSIQYLHRASRLANVRPKGLYASPNLFAYFETFEHLDHPVIRKLLKKVFLNLETVDKMAVFY